VEPLPTYSQNDLFATDFTPHSNLPGFFPGAGGFFHGHPNTSMRFLFFGTDFGPLAYQQGLREKGGEPENVVTLRQLRAIVSQAGIPLSHCFLTNAVLCTRRGESATAAFPIWTKYPDYVDVCARWHRRHIAAQKPDAIVLMGLPHLHYFGRLLFPELAQHWAGLKTMKSVYAQGKEVFSLPDGINVLLLLHPSFWHAHPPALKAKAIERLSKWA
jgi:uracil-DNA glycosylase